MRRSQSIIVHVLGFSPRRGTMHECLGNPIIVKRVRICESSNARSSASCFRRCFSLIASRVPLGTTGPNSGGFLKSSTNQALYASTSSADESKDNEGGPLRGAVAPDLLGAEMPRNKSPMEPGPFVEASASKRDIIPARSAGVKPMRDINWTRCCGSMVGERKRRLLHCGGARALYATPPHVDGACGGSRSLPLNARRSSYL